MGRGEDANEIIARHHGEIEALADERGLRRRASAAGTAAAAHQGGEPGELLMGPSASSSRKGGTPDQAQREIYRTLRISEEVMKPVRTWHELS